MNWKVDDDVIEGASGKKRINDAIAKHDIPIGGVLTSQDRGVDASKNDLDRANMPAGITSWELPVLPKGGAFVFLSTAGASAVVPKHSHKRDLFRVVISGSITTDAGIKLSSGDWMFVPAGTEYGYTAASNPGALLLHFYD